MLILQTWPKKNGQRRYKYLVLGRDISYFVKHHSDSTKKFSEADIFKEYMLIIGKKFRGAFGRHSNITLFERYLCNLRIL
jgi:hypothetical protein